MNDSQISISGDQIGASNSDRMTSNKDEDFMYRNAVGSIGCTDLILKISSSNDYYIILDSNVKSARQLSSTVNIKRKVKPS